MTAPSSPEVRIQVGPVTLAYETQDLRLLQWAHDAHPHHVCDLPADVVVRLAYSENTSFPFKRRNAVRNGHVDELCFWEGRGQLDTKTGRGSATLAPMANEDFERLRMKGLTRILVSRYLLSRGGMAFHACGVVHHSCGYLFVGPSGAGKTTIATRWSAGTMLGDDQILVMQTNAGEFRIYDTPFPGHEGTPTERGNAPLKQVLVLSQEPYTSVVPLSSSDAFRALTRQVFHIGNTSDEANAIYAFLEALVASVPVSRLNFNLKDDIWPAIERGVHSV